MGIERPKSLLRNALLIVITTFVALILRSTLPAEHRALYGDLAQWLSDNALPNETIAMQQAGLAKYLTGRSTILLPADADTFSLIAALDQARPDYCIAANSLAWQGVQRQPWFQERYRLVYQVTDPYDAATPLTVFRYTPSPFDDGAVSSTQMIFSANGEQIELSGYRLDSPRLTPGEPSHLTLYWHALTEVNRRWRLVVRLVDPASGREWLRAENDAPGGLATDLWNAGTQLQDRYALTPPADLPPGDYALQLAWVLPNGSAPALAGASGGHVTLAQVSHPPDVSAAPLTPDHPLSATFGGEIELLGYDVAARRAPGQTLRVALYWRARQPTPVNYKVFVHLVGPDEHLLAQDDSLPVGWTYPTTQWQPGEIIRDEHLLTISASAARGDYRLFAGLYDVATGERPPVRDAAGDAIADRRVFLQVIEVR